MTLHLQHLLLLGLFGAALHWIVARSQVAKPFWSRLRGWPAKLLACPACSGFWIGLGLRGAGLTPVRFDGGGASLASAAVEALAAGVLAVFLTPVFQAVMLWGLHYSAVQEPEPEVPATDVSGPPPTTPMQP
jgi:hypothetical protein